MGLDLKHKAFLGLAGAGLLTASIAAGSWLGAREDTIRMKATLEAQKQVIEQAQADRTQRAKEDAARDAQTAATLQAMQAEMGKLKTPAQHAAWDQTQLEQVIRGIHVEIPAATSQNPHPDAVVTLPQSSLPDVTQAIEGCKECKVKLDTAEKNVASRDEQMKLADTQIGALKKERDAAITAAKGGSFWSRTKRAAKWFAIGAAAGAIAAKTSHR